MEEKEKEVKETKEVVLEKYNTKSWFKSGFTGFLLGLAVILPGISGSTIAILFKLYDKLLYSVSNIFKKFKVCFLFLLPILLGGLIGFILGFFVIQNVIENYTFIVVSIFGGLMLGAAPEIVQVIKKEKITPLRISLVLIGLAIPIVLSASFASIQELDVSYLFNDFPWWIHIVAFLVGILISLTQIIPGLSATVLLMSIGFFQPMMGAVHFDTLINQPIWILFFLMFILGFVVESVTLDDESNQKIDNYELSSNQFMQQGTLTGAYANAVQDAAKNEAGAMNGFLGVGMMNMATGGMMGGVVANAGNTQVNHGNTQVYDPYANQAAQLNQARGVDTSQNSVSQQQERAVKGVSFCPNCGIPTNGANFCSNCGAKLK